MNFAGIDENVPEDVGGHILSFLDIPTLVCKKAISRSPWKKTVHHTRWFRKRTHSESFSVTEGAVKGHEKIHTKYNLVDADKFAETFGWPISRWDVSNIQDFSYLLISKKWFNENID
jgi:hypothetical protein